MVHSLSENHNVIIEPAHYKTYKTACATSKYSDQPQWVRRAQAFFMRTTNTLIRLGGRPG